MTYCINHLFITHIQHYTNENFNRSWNEFGGYYTPWTKANPTQYCQANSIACDGPTPLILQEIKFCKSAQNQHKIVQVLTLHRMT
jgi:hypothetical protein